ncbi:hypothetical protein MYA_5860 [Burkholderia stabilis]|nr:hypothetical protein MYA_5860 [Burkholderia stabilis]
MTSFHLSLHAVRFSDGPSIGGRNVRFYPLSSAGIREFRKPDDPAAARGRARGRLRVCADTAAPHSFLRCANGPILASLARDLRVPMAGLSGYSGRYPDRATGFPNTGNACTARVRSSMTGELRWLKFPKPAGLPTPPVSITAT